MREDVKRAILRFLAPLPAPDSQRDDAAVPTSTQTRTQNGWPLRKAVTDRELLAEANRVRGVRAALYYGGPTDIIKLSRMHNNANVLSLSARFVSYEEAQAAVKLWLSTHFEGDERHQRRILKMDYNGN